MDLRKVIFVGGDPATHASVQIRCVDIATRLGCKISLRARSASQIPEGHSVFVCVKPWLPPGELQRLARRGQVVWDIIDMLPPRDHISLYLTSTALGRQLFDAYGRVKMIPHHHCNFSNRPNPGGLRTPVWLGSRPWLPRLCGFAHETHFVDGMTQRAVVRIFRRTGIGLNLRNRRKSYELARRHAGDAPPGRRRKLERFLFDFHLALNSGIKLINCLGFGIPSISSDEPAYREVGGEATVFSGPRGCARWVDALQHDEGFYRHFRRQCIAAGRRFHIQAVLEEYKNLFAAL